MIKMNSNHANHENHNMNSGRFCGQKVKPHLTK